MPVVWGTDSYTMMIRFGDLKRLIKEELVDKVRLPRGPNSRDDADDRSLDDPMEDRENVENMSWNAKG